MSKEKVEKQEVNPFNNFTLLKGEFTPPETVESDIETTDDVVSDETDEQKRLEAERLAAGDKALKEQEALRAKKVNKKTVEPENTEEVENTTEVEEEEEAEDTSLLKVFTKDLYEEGVLDFDDSDEDFEDSKKGISKLVNKTVENRINKFIESLPPDLNALMEFVQNGGKPKDFMDVYYSNQSWGDLDLENENNQKLIVRESLKLSGESEEDIEDMIKEWDENGTLNKRAKSGQTKLVKYTEAKKAEILEQKKIEAENKRKADEKYFKDLKTDLMKKEEILGFKLTPKLKEKLWDYMTVPDSRTGKTAYQEAVEQQEDAKWLFALQAMNGFDKSKLEVQTRTKVSKEFGNLLRNYQKTTKEKISAGSNEENYNTNPFEAFKSPNK